VEDQGRPPALTPPADWIESPAVDLAVFANVGWLLAMVPGFAAADGTTHIDFWQLYFLTTPHRWLTLVLVAADPDRRAGRPLAMAAVAGALAVVVAGVWLGTGGLRCLGLVDFAWNGWHFAAQHAGVLRVYSLKTGGGRPRLEKHGLRLFVCYVIARTAGWTTGWVEESDLAAGLLAVDVVALTLAAWLVLPELPTWPRRPGKVTYLVSVVGLYSTLLVALMSRSASLVLALTAAAATYHAVEYLALVTYYARRRAGQGSPGRFRSVARHWPRLLAGYVLVVGLVAAALQPAAATWWVGVNLWASFVHYAYDGLIWKLRRPETAQALGAAA